MPNHLPHDRHATSGSADRVGLKLVGVLGRKSLGRVEKVGVVSSIRRRLVRSGRTADCRDGIRTHRRLPIFTPYSYTGALRKSHAAEMIVGKDHF